MRGARKLENFPVVYADGNTKEDLDIFMANRKYYRWQEMAWLTLAWHAFAISCPCCSTQDL
jgi:hypothetical protein